MHVYNLGWNAAQAYYRNVGMEWGSKKMGLPNLESYIGSGNIILPDQWFVPDLVWVDSNCFSFGSFWVEFWLLRVGSSLIWFFKGKIRIVFQMKKYVLEYEQLLILNIKLILTLSVELGADPDSSIGRILTI